MVKRNWKRVQPNSLTHAFVLCKDHAREVKNLSVERIAALMGQSPDALYKWLGTGRMPSILVPTYELACGANYVTRWHAASGGLLVFPMPTGRHATAEDMQALQSLLHTAVGSLISFYAGKAEHEQTLADIRSGMEALAWHHGNVAEHHAPQLDLGDHA